MRMQVHRCARERPLPRQVRATVDEIEAPEPTEPRLLATATRRAARPDIGTLRRKLPALRRQAEADDADHNERQHTYENAQQQGQPRYCGASEKCQNQSDSHNHSTRGTASSFDVQHPSDPQTVTDIRP
jgi:hypothetical protein